MIHSLQDLSAKGRRRARSKAGFMLVVNPRARNGRAQAKIDELRRALNDQGIPYDLQQSESLEHARALSREANLAGYHTVVAVGGDGTVNRVLDGFFARDGTRLSRARFAAIHVGTSPDFSRSYGVPTDIREAVAALASGMTTPIYPGRVSYQYRPPDAGSNGAAASTFACCANAGFGANLARLANGGIRKRVGDFAGTFLCLLWVLRAFRPVTLRLQVDGVERQIENVCNVAVGRSRFIASGIQIRHQLGATDPRLYVVCLRALSLMTLVPVLCVLYGGRPLHSRSYLSIAYGHKVSVRAPDRAVELEFDGDPAGWCPADFSVASEPVDLLVPAS